MSAELYDMIYDLMLAFGISSIAGIILLIFGMRLWEMRCAELELKKHNKSSKKSSEGAKHERADNF
ncbi:MAG: hypothetical protein ACI4QZ_07255 [Eubacteriales bacterium]